MPKLLKTVNSCNIYIKEEFSKEVFKDAMVCLDGYFLELPYKSKNLEICFEESENFEILQGLEKEVFKNRENKNWKGRFTSCMLVSNFGEIVSTATQNINLHQNIDLNGNCIREQLKYQNRWIPSDGYEICKGCSKDNHAEAMAIKKYQSLKKHIDLKDGVAYINNHWWCCKDCSDKLEFVGIKKVVLNKKWVKMYLNLE